MSVAKEKTINNAAKLEQNHNTVGELSRRLTDCFYVLQSTS
jgi:hypothetical protein